MCATDTQVNNADLLNAVCYGCSYCGIDYGRSVGMLVSNAGINGLIMQLVVVLVLYRAEVVNYFLAWSF